MQLDSWCVHTERRQSRRRRQPPFGGSIGEDCHQREREPESRRGVDERRQHRQCTIDDAATSRGLYHADWYADEKRQEKRRGAEADRDGQSITQRRRYGLFQRETLAEVAMDNSLRPPCILNGDRLVETELGANPRRISRGCRRRNEKRRGVTRSKTDERERDRQNEPEEQQHAGKSAQHGARMHGLKLHRRVALSTLALMILVATVDGACFSPQRPSDVAVYASGTDLESGNPLVTIHSLSRQIQRYALFVTLARYDADLLAEPYAATRWEWSADRRALSFHLVSDLYWHDDTLTTARDVAFTIDAARDPRTGYWRTADLADVDSVTAPDDSTAIVYFRLSQSAFPLVFCELPILPAHLLASVPHQDMRRAAFNFAPVGNGPFRFVERRPGARWTFRRNDRFPSSLGGPPRLAGFVVTVVDEPTTKFAGLASGDLDVAGIAPTMAALASRDRSLRVVDYPILFTTGLIFNSAKPPFDDVRVRRAISISIDRRRIVDAALAGYGKPAGGPVPPESPLALSGPPDHDVRLADSLLDAAGWLRTADGVRRRNGQPFAFDLLTVGSGDNALEQLLQADLAARGITARIKQVELGTFLTEARATPKRFDALVAGIPGDVALAFLASMFESRQAGGALDYAGFHRARLDTLFANTRRATTDSARSAAWRDVQRELAADAPVAWIYHSRGVQGISARLRNVTMDLRGEMPTLARWEVTPSTLAAGR